MFLGRALNELDECVITEKHLYSVPTILLKFTQCGEVSSQWLKCEMPLPTILVSSKLSPV